MCYFFMRNADCYSWFYTKLLPFPGTNTNISMCNFITDLVRDIVLCVVAVWQTQVGVVYVFSVIYFDLLMTASSLSIIAGQSYQSTGFMQIVLRHLCPCTHNFAICQLHRVIVFHHDFLPYPVLV